MSKVSPFECRSCGKAFASLQAFDDHRTGTHHPDTRRCRTTDEMAAQGQTSTNGVFCAKLPRHLLTV